MKGRDVSHLISLSPYPQHTKHFYHPTHIPSYTMYIHQSLLLLLPVLSQLAGAIPTARDTQQLTFQSHIDAIPAGGHEGFSLDLKELRLVQFGHDEAPV
jgi:hypothetical protein